MRPQITTFASGQVCSRCEPHEQVQMQRFWHSHAAWGMFCKKFEDEEFCFTPDVNSSNKGTFIPA